MLYEQSKNQLYAVYLHGEITEADWGCADVWWLLRSSLEFDDEAGALEEMMVHDDRQCLFKEARSNDLKDLMAEVKIICFSHVDWKHAGKNIKTARLF